MSWNFRTLLMRLILARSSIHEPRKLPSLSVAYALAQVDDVFGQDRSMTLVEKDATVPYFTQSEWAYSAYHSGVDCIHMAINENGVFDPDGYYAQPRHVAKQIEVLNAQSVLEVGAGKGFNSHFLAQQFQAVKFVGLDLTPLHIDMAREKSRSMTNLTYQQGDFSALPFPDQSFDIVFGFETLCYAADSSKPLNEIYRVLRPGGQLIVYDAFRETSLDQWPLEDQAAVKLTEISMAVRHGFAEIAQWQAIAQTAGFEVLVQRNIAATVQPSLQRLQNLAMRFFRLRWRAKLLNWVAPHYLIRNVIAGLLMPYVCCAHASPIGYYQIVLSKSQNA